LQLGIFIFRSNFNFQIINLVSRLEFVIITLLMPFLWLAPSTLPSRDTLDPMSHIEDIGVDCVAPFRVPRRDATDLPAPSVLDGHCRVSQLAQDRDRGARGTGLTALPLSVVRANHRRGEVGLGGDPGFREALISGLKLHLCLLKVHGSSGSHAVANISPSRYRGLLLGRLGGGPARGGHVPQLSEVDGRLEFEKGKVVVGCVGRPLAPERGVIRVRNSPLDLVDHCIGGGVPSDQADPGVGSDFTLCCSQHPSVVEEGSTAFDVDRC